MASFRLSIAIMVIANALRVAFLNVSDVRAEEGDLFSLRSEVRSSSEPYSYPLKQDQSEAPGQQEENRRKELESQETQLKQKSPDDPNSPRISIVDNNPTENSGKMFLYAVTSPFWVPMYMLDDNIGNAWCYQLYPYEQTRGYTFNLEAAEAYHENLRDPNLNRQGVLPDQSDIYPREIRSKRWSLRAAAEYGDSFDRLRYTGGSLLFSTTSRFGFDASWRYFEEPLASGHIDSLNLGKADITFQLAQSERAQIRFGLGTNWMVDMQETDFGFNFNYAVDLFPCKPWVLSAELDAGTLVLCQT
jgi:hypothetical protein